MTQVTPLSGHFGQLVIIGGSIGGSSLAGAVAPWFDRVVIIERDILEDHPAKRKGAPHAYHFHTLTPLGLRVLEDIFPQLTKEMRELGAPFVDPIKMVRQGTKAGFLPRRDSELRLLRATRPLLEWYLRKRASAVPNVEYRTGLETVGLIEESGRIVGVRTRDPHNAISEVPADFVVDASGRGSRAPRWLAELGYPEPEETVVNAHWGYATTYVKVPSEWEPGDYGSISVSPKVGKGTGAAASRGASLWRNENDLVVVTAQGNGRDYPPRDLKGMMEFVSSFGYDEFRGVLEAFQAVSPVEIWRSTANRRRKFSAMPRHLEGFAAMGDSVAAMNPVYGHGMTLAFVAARKFREAVVAHIASGGIGVLGLGQRFQQGLEPTIDAAWALSTASDFRVPGVEVNGKPYTYEPTEQSEYMDRVLALATEDADLALKYMETALLMRGREWSRDEDLRARVEADWDRLGSVAREP